MKKALRFLIASWLFLNFSGCVPLAIGVGAAACALGGYAVSNDTIQGETEKSYESVWDSALTVSRFRGKIKQEDAQKGYIQLEAGASQVWVRVIRLSLTTTRLRICARKHHLADLDLAQELYVKILEEAK